MAIGPAANNWQVDDVRGGSGFSFNEIGPNRAGARFGKVSSKSAPGARELAWALAAGVAERDLMPDTSDLPEYMPEAAFRRPFGGLGNPDYEQMIAKIEQRIDATPLLRK